MEGFSQKKVSCLFFACCGHIFSDSSPKPFSNHFLSFPSPLKGLRVFGCFGQTSQVAKIPQKIGGSYIDGTFFQNKILIFSVVCQS